MKNSSNLPTTVAYYFRSFAVTPVVESMDSASSPMQYRRVLICWRPLDPLQREIACKAVAISASRQVLSNRKGLWVLAEAGTFFLTHHCQHVLFVDFIVNNNHNRNQSGRNRRKRVGAEDIYRLKKLFK